MVPLLSRLRRMRRHHQRSCSCGWGRPGGPTAPAPIQKLPYVPKAVAPDTLRFRNSHMPASSWATPPQAKAKPSQASPVAFVIQPTLAADNRNVVSAKAASPRGAGSAAGAIMTLLLFLSDGQVLPPLEGASAKSRADLHSGMVDARVERKPRVACNLI